MPPIIRGQGLIRCDSGYKPIMRIEVERLIKQAEHDLENARKNIGIEAFEVAAFLAEQAA